MFIRYAILALLLSALGAAPAWAQKLKLPYPQIIDLPELIPPPPAPDSQALKDDLAGVMEAQENRNEIQLRRALAQKTLTIYHFTEVLGPKFKKENLPVMDAFFEKAHVDQRATLIAAKNTIQRLRPFLVDNRGSSLGRHATAAHRLSQRRNHNDPNDCDFARKDDP